jgi:cytochrome c peroxidase
MKKLFFLSVLLSVVFSSYKIIDALNFKTPKNWPKPVYDFSKNPLSKNKIELGRALFYDTQLSRNNTISCANCHSQFTAFTHVDHALSHGIDDKIGARNSPALMNLAWQNSFMWDGAINHLDMQALAPISNALEMDEKIENVVKKLQGSKIYPKLFYAAFKDSIITGERTLKALSQFMLTLVSANTKYDSVMLKQKQFTAQEKNGYELFKKNCGNCHKEPLFTNQQFENNGLPIDKNLNDIGKMKITQNPKDSLRFKVPTLRNIEFSYPYMHDGRFKTLNQVLNHYTNGIEKNKTLSEPLKQAIVLTSNEKVDLIAFLLTLTDKKFLFNPNFSFPKNILLPKPKD